jgi:hypothetical protein
MILSTSAICCYVGIMCKLRNSILVIRGLFMLQIGTIRLLRGVGTFNVFVIVIKYKRRKLSPAGG